MKVRTDENGRNWFLLDEIDKDSARRERPSTRKYELHPSSPHSTRCGGCGRVGICSQDYTTKMHRRDIDPVVGFQGYDVADIPVPHIRRHCDNCGMTWLEELYGKGGGSNVDFTTLLLRAALVLMLLFAATLVVVGVSSWVMGAM
jgi:hypothetical protein